MKDQPAVVDPWKLAVWQNKPARVDWEFRTWLFRDKGDAVGFFTWSLTVNLTKVGTTKATTTGTTTLTAPVWTASTGKDNAKVEDKRLNDVLKAGRYRWPAKIKLIYYDIVTGNFKAWAPKP